MWRTCSLHMMEPRVSPLIRFLPLFFMFGLFVQNGFGAPTGARPHRKRPVRATTKVVAKAAAVRTAVAKKPAAVRAASFQKAKSPSPFGPAPVVIAGGPWISPTYADSTDGDRIDGEDLDIR